MRKNYGEHDAFLFEMVLPQPTPKPATTKQAVIYTDGACVPNPGFGGWAAVILEGEQKRVVSGSATDTTNNRMELQGAIEALRVLAEPYQVRLFTDSQYVRDGITRWLPNWERRGWKTKRKHSVLNQDLWKELSRLTKQRNVDWQWVRGHNGDPLNEQCNQLAQDQARARRQQTVG